MLPRQILKSRASEITQNAFQSQQKFVKVFNIKIKINNNDKNENNKLLFVGLQHTQPHSSTVSLLKAQTGNEQDPFEGSDQLDVFRYRLIKEFIQTM